MKSAFSLQHANQLAHILNPAEGIAAYGDLCPRNLNMDILFNAAEKRFQISEYARESEAPDLFYGNHVIRKNSKRIKQKRSIEALREYYSKPPLIALLIPSGNDPLRDTLLTSPELYEQLVRLLPEDSGLILQVERLPKSKFFLSRVYPALRVALSDVTRWPGVLIWTPDGNASFFELSRSEAEIKKRLNWIFSCLIKQHGKHDLTRLSNEYKKLIHADKRRDSRIRIIHLSDLHLGSEEANLKLQYVRNIIKDTVNMLGTDDPIIPVITGDLMDTPTDENLTALYSFLEFLEDLDVKKPIVLLGNHDMRHKGILTKKLDQALHIPQNTIVWMDEYDMAFICFNSASKGYLARGRIGEREYINIANELLKQKDRADRYTLIAALHHHPIPVRIPEWYKKTWYESVFGSQFEKTDALADSALLMKWLSERKISAVLHGHKHIPRFNIYKKIAVIGCGSSVGKVNTEEVGETYMSFNVITIDRSTNSLGCIIQAERIPGGGMHSVSSHEMVISSELRT
jgi:predicted MPP superfamily phosphohydrolase